MFVNDQLIFIELHKTGTSSIVRQIDAVQPGKTVRDRYGHKHNRLKESTAGRRIVGSVRNPFDWYVSLWSYGCAGKGTLYWQLTAPYHRLARSMVKRTVLMPGQRAAALKTLGLGLRNDPAFWRQVYSDAQNPALFQDWLRAIMSERGKRHMTEGYQFLPLHRVVGFYTYRFLYLFTDYAAWDREISNCIDYPSLREFYERAGIVETFVRTEHIREDVANLLVSLGEGVYEVPVSENRLNQSTHRSTADYYTDETRALVLEQDRMIFDLFGYDQTAPNGSA